MIKRIEITNFMSHAHTVIEPAEGLTVIVGDNNTGKSALVSAFQVLCRNAPGDYMVRHGARECSIRVFTDDGHEIEWVRKGKVVSYRINGRDVHRLGGAVPEDLHDLLRLPLVETENEPFDIHFGEQKKPIFLLNESASRRATFFASSSDTIKLIEMQGRHRKKIQEARAAETELVRREAALKRRRDQLAPVDALGDAIVHLETEYERILADSAELEVCERNIRALKTAAATMAQYAGSVAAVRALAPPPRIDDVDPLSRLVRQIRNRKTEIDRESRRMSIALRLSPPPEQADTRSIREMIRQIDLLGCRAAACLALQEASDPLVPPPNLPDSQGLSQLIGKNIALRKDCEVVEAKTGILDTLPDPPEIFDLQPLKRLIGTLSGACSNRVTAEVAGACLGVLPEPPVISDTSGLVARIDHLASAHQSCGRLEKAIDKIRTEQDAAKAALAGCIEATGVCPTCGQDLNPEDFIDRIPLAGGESR